MGHSDNHDHLLPFADHFWLLQLLQVYRQVAEPAKATVRPCDSGCSGQIRQVCGHDGENDQRGRPAYSALTDG